MNSFVVNQLFADLLIVLAAGFLSGALCKRMGVSLLVGYLIVGAVSEKSGVGFFSQEHRELWYLTRAGAMFLLFSIGIGAPLETA